MQRLFWIFQSTLPVWGATGNASHLDRALRISIHAPRVGSDGHTHSGVHGETDFNPRSPCGERRWGASGLPWRAYFNPRSPCGERPRRRENGNRLGYFNPRSPCGERHEGLYKGCYVSRISIHAPRVGSDLLALPRTITFGLFQSTLPVWGATLDLFAFAATGWHFNPRSPCGERQSESAPFAAGCYFNPRSPCGERRSVRR